MKETTKVLMLALLMLILPTTAIAQEYPNKPIKIIVGFVPGGGSDIAARLIAPKLQEAFGQPVVVENHPGAGTNIAQRMAVTAPPDGYTLLLSPPAVISNKFLYKNLPFDTHRDLVGVSLFSSSPNLIIVSASSPVKNLKELVALARKQPDKLSFASSGSGQVQHLAGELFNLRAGVKTLHVPYKGTNPAITAVISGEVDISFSNVPSAIAQIKAGRLRVLATTGAERSELLPDVPTAKEAGVNMVIGSWWGVFAPSATPPTVIDKLSKALVKIAKTPEMKTRLHALGAEPIGSTSAEFMQFIRAEIPMWEEVIKVSSAKPE